jgi:hypothetical protein
MPQISNENYIGRYFNIFLSMMFLLLLGYLYMMMFDKKSVRTNLKYNLNLSFLKSKFKSVFKIYPVCDV